MIKEFCVMNRTNARKYCFRTHHQTSAIISIYSRFDEPARLPKREKNKIKHVLRVGFDDVSSDDIGCMTKEDAEKIASFVKRNARSVDRLIVHCDAGVSRSAGICAAIMKRLTGDDSRIFDNPFYKPNMHCYRLVFNALATS